MRMYIVCSVGGIKPFPERPGFLSGLLENQYDRPCLRDEDKMYTGSISC